MIQSQIVRDNIYKIELNYKRLGNTDEIPKNACVCFG
jgi:hypothetical protein